MSTIEATTDTAADTTADLHVARFTTLPSPAEIEAELPVGELVSRVGLSPSALSQHLAKLREQGLVGYRREAQTLYYRVTDARAAQVLSVLQDIYCPELAPRRSTQVRGKARRSP